MTARLILNRLSSCCWKSSEQSERGQRPSEGVLECLGLGCRQWILWVLWIVDWSLCGLGLCPADTIRAHKIGFLGVLRPAEHDRLFIMFFELFIRSFCQPLLSRWGGCYCRGVPCHGGNNIHVNVRIQVFPKRTLHLYKASKVTLFTCGCRSDLKSFCTKECKNKSKPDRIHLN